MLLSIKLIDFDMDIFSWQIIYVYTTKKPACNLTKIKKLFWLTFAQKNTI